MTDLNIFSDAKMPIVVSTSVMHQVMYQKKCNLTAKFYILKAESDESVEQKLLYLNMALSNAASDEIILEIYKKRVNIYADLGMHQQCNENEEWIQVILQQPQQGMYLKRRRLPINFNLGRKTNPKFPGLIPAVVVSSNNNLMAKNSSIKSGKLIAKEEPFCGVLLESALYRRCRNCLSCNNMNLIPCVKCQLAMFCSPKCLNEAKFHHNYECEAQQIAKVPFNIGGVQVALRALFELLAYFEDSVNKMMNFVKTCRNNQQQTIQIDEAKPLELEKFSVMISLKKLPSSDCQDEIMNAINNVVDIYPKIKELFVTEEEKEFLTDFLYMQSTLDYIVHYDHKLQTPTALSVNFIYNLLPHSCASNVHSIMDDGKFYYFAKYPIGKGETLTYNHILNFEDFAYDIRKITAKKCNNFDCKCKACIKQYPTKYSMKVFNVDVLKNAMTQRENIPNMIKKDLNKTLKENCKYIDSQYPTQFPCQEIYMLQQCNSLILSQLVL